MIYTTTEQETVKKKIEYFPIINIDTKGNI